MNHKQKYLKRGWQRCKHKYVPRVLHAHACPLLLWCMYAFSWEPSLFVLHFGAPLPKNRCCPKVIEVPHQDESFFSQINPLSHFKCLIAGGPSTLWIASSPRYTFLLGIPNLTRSLSTGILEGGPKVSSIRCPVPLFIFTTSPKPAKKAICKSSQMMGQLFLLPF